MQCPAPSCPFMSYHESANVNFLQADHSLFLTISRSGSLPPCLISSFSMSMHSLLTQLLSPACTVNMLNHLSMNMWYALYMSAGAQCVIYVRRHNNCIPGQKFIGRYIYTLAQIQPPHCMISFLASHLAINTLNFPTKWRRLANQDISFGLKGVGNRKVPWYQTVNH